MRRPSPFPKKADVTRFAKAVQAAGLDVARVEVNRDGVIRVVTEKRGDIPSDQDANEWDEVLPDG